GSIDSTKTAFIVSHCSPACLLWAFTQSASCCSRARWRLSGRQYCRRPGSSFEPHDWGFNTAVGLFSLRSDTTGGLNTALGAGTLLANTSSENTATGAGTLLSNTTGSSNTGNGAFALFSNSTGNFNTAVGDRALFNNTGDDNTAIGNGALFQNTTGLGNIA